MILIFVTADLYRFISIMLKKCKQSGKGESTNQEAFLTKVFGVKQRENLKGLSPQNWQIFKNLGKYGKRVRNAPIYPHRIINKQVSYLSMNHAKTTK